MPQFFPQLEERASPSPFPSSQVINDSHDSTYSILYENDEGTYNESGIPFGGLNGNISNINFEDYDNDSDLDLLYWSAEHYDWEYYWYNDLITEEPKFKVYYYQNDDTTFNTFNLGLNEARIRNIGFADYDYDNRRGN